MPAHRKIDLLEAYRLRHVGQLTYQQIAELQGVTKQAVSSALYRFAESLPTQAQLTEFTHVKTSLLNAVEEQLIASCADPESIRDASLLDRARAFKAIHTANRLEHELSTANVSTKMSLLIQSADASLFASTDTSSSASAQQEQAIPTEASKNQ